MSWTKEVTIWCDSPNCNEWVRDGSARATDLRKIIRDDGWTHKNGNDYCPECSNE